MPRPDGTPTILELLTESAIEDVGKDLKATEVLAQLRDQLGREPAHDDVMRFLGIDPRADKPWPPWEDCAGCPSHKDGPHKFGCQLHGAYRIILPARS